MSDTGAPDTGTVNTTADVVTQTVDLPPEADLAAEVEKWKTQARKHEDRAKANAEAAKELERLKAASMSDMEKAAAVARAEGRAEALAEVGSRLVDAELRAVFAGRGVDTDAILEGLDRARFLNADGEPDVAALTAWADRIAPRDARPGVPDLGQGVRGGQATALNGDPLLRDLKNLVGK